MNNNLILMTPKHGLNELKAVEEFLKWQTLNYEVVEDFEVVRFTEGKVQPILMKNDMVMAKGFLNIIEYIKSEGLLLC